MRVTSKNGVKKSVGQEQGIGAVRDLIFGEQMKEYEVRFSNLEMKLSNKMQKLNKKIEQLDKTLKMVDDINTKILKNKIDKQDLSEMFKKMSDKLSSI